SEERRGMKKNALYSSRRPKRAPSLIQPRVPAPTAAPEPQPETKPINPNGMKARWERFYAKREKELLVFSGGVFALVAFVAFITFGPHPHQYTQRDIDLAVRSTLEHTPPGPNVASRAYAMVRPSVVRVNQLEKEKDSDEMEVKGVGTGVVIDES